FCMAMLMGVYCFFFQAEDGIRDSSVTGVQTCALPISYRTSNAQALTELNDQVFGGAYCERVNLPPAAPSHHPKRHLFLWCVRPRSEERRVGKGCRYRG